MRPACSAKHTGTTWGRPAPVTVARWPTRAWASRSSAVAGGKLGILLHQREHLVGALVGQLEQRTVDAGLGDRFDELVGGVGAEVRDREVAAGALAQLGDPVLQPARLGDPVRQPDV